MCVYCICTKKTITIINITANAKDIITNSLDDEFFPVNIQLAVSN